jgi:hypothetical protein
MKKLYLTFVFLALCSFFNTIQGQGRWQYFFKPIPIDKIGFKSLGTKENWYFKPAITVIANEFSLVKENGKLKVNTSVLSSTGVGISYQNYIFDDNGNLYNNFGVNCILLFGTNIEPVNGILLFGDEKTSIKAAITVNLFQYISMGAGYDFTNKVPIIITGVVIHFNK